MVIIIIIIVICELPHVQPPIVVHVCPRHQLVNLRMGGIIAYEINTSYFFYRFLPF